MCVWLEKRHVYETDFIWNPSTCSCKKRKYLASIMDDLAHTCDEFIDVEEAKAIAKNITYKTQNFYISLTFLLVIITLLITVSIYCYLIKYWAKL